MSVFNQELQNMLREEKEISPVVRQRLDHVYDEIRMNQRDSVSHQKGHWTKWIAAVAALISCILILSNDTVQASLKRIFGQNKAAQTAEEHGFFNQVDEKSADQGITLQLTKVFADSGHIGFQINGLVEDASLLKDVEAVYFNYYIKDSQGEYVIDQLGDERFPLKSNNPYEIGAGSSTLADCDEQKGTFIQQIIVESTKGLIPDLDHSTIEIVSVGFSNSQKGQAVTVDGLWEMPFNPDFQNKAIQPVSFKVTEIEGCIEDLTAEADAAGLRIAFKCDQDSEVLENLGKIAGILGYSIAEMKA